MKKAKLGMKWHTFLIWYGLFLRAIHAVRNGIVLMLSAFLGDDMQQSGAEKCGLIVFSLAAFWLVVYTVYTRCELARFRRRAPLELTYLAAMDFILRLCTTIFHMTIQDGTIAELLSWVPLVNLFSPILFLIINYFYYAKRTNLFVN